MFPVPTLAAAAPHADGARPAFAAGEWILRIGEWVEAGGVAVILVGVVVTTLLYLWNLRRRGAHEAYPRYRKGLARSILLGLELLVAGDIIRTVVVEPSAANVATLAAIVLIRTFLSFTLELEITGRWPWRREAEGAPTDRLREV